MAASILTSKNGENSAAHLASIDRMILDRHGGDLIKLIVRTIKYGCDTDRVPKVAVDTFAKELRIKRATFVTLEREGKLRGCIGSIIASKPLVLDLVDNAFRAAFRDPRFEKLTREESKGLGISFSMLSPLSIMNFSSEEDLISQLQPGTDGVLLQDADKRSVFLPQVWEQLPQADAFLSRLKLKAGLSEDHWSSSVQAWRFSVQKVPPLGIRRHIEQQRAAEARGIGSPITVDDQNFLSAQEELDKDSQEGFQKS